MPTGYTSYIEDGKINNAKDFIMLCARAFGATIMMRDESLDAPIPEFKPSTYHLEQLEKAKQRLEEFKNMTNEQLQQEIDDNYNKEMEYRKQAIKEKLELKEKYLNVLNDIYAWKEPTPEHRKLKEFAIDQIKDSMQWDCSTEYYEQEYIKPTLEESRKLQIETALKDIKYYTKQNQEEIERTNERNLWVKQLRESFK